MSKTDLVSIIISAHNAQEYINTAIDSLLLQTHKDIEILVVDCQSTDSTASVIQHYNDKRVRYIQHDSTAISGGLRQGYTQAQGQYIAFMDSDSISYPQRIASQLQYLIDNVDVALTATNYIPLDKDNCPIDESHPIEFSLRKQFLTAHPLATGSILFDKDKIGTIPDIDLQTTNFIKTVALSNKIALLPEPLYGWRILPVYNDFFLAETQQTEAAISNYDLWLTLVSSYPLGTVWSSAKTDESETTRRLLDNANHSLFQPNLTTDQYVMVEEDIEILYKKLNSLKDSHGDTPLISVVMSVYNAGVFLRPAIQSILDQTFKNFEFIIVNDGSTDGSQEVIESFNDPRIRLINQTNHRLVYSLNKGVRLARAALIARMDADDISMPSRFEKEIALMATNPRLGLIAGFFAYIDEETSATTGTVITAPTKHLDLRRNFYISNPFAHGCTMYRKEAYMQAGGYRDDFGPTEDFDLWQRIADCEWELEQIPEIMYLYRLNPNGISAQKQDIQHKFTAELLELQWRKAFVYKGYRSIVRDGKYYLHADNDYAERIYHQYVHSQYLLAMEMFVRGWMQRGLITALATIRLDRSKWRALWRPSIGGFLRYIGIREKKS